MTSALVFDIDNTLTPPRRPLEREMAEALQAIAGTFALAAGSDIPILEDQFFGPLHDFGYRGGFDAFVCNGATRLRCEYNADGFDLEITDDMVLVDHLGNDAYLRLLAAIERTLDRPEFALPGSLHVIGDRIVERGSMINATPIGRPKGNLAPAELDSRDRFVAFDKDTSYRVRMRAELRRAFDEAIPGNDLFLSFGGQTSFDIGVRGRDKSYAVRSLLDEGFDTVTYFGDALFPGGNDAAVIDYQATLGADADRLKIVPVDTWTDTLRFLKNRR